MSPRRRKLKYTQIVLVTIATAGACLILFLNFEIPFQYPVKSSVFPEQPSVYKSVSSHPPIAYSPGVLEIWIPLMNGIIKHRKLSQDEYLYPKPWPLLDLRLQYVINNDICGKSKVLLLILVTSHAGDSQLRKMLRQEFNQSELVRLGIRRVFLLATVDPKSGQQKYHDASSKEIETENAAHGDLIQGNFTEHYRNLTYKHFMGLEWSNRYCPQATFVIKQDDDVFVDIYGILQHLRSTALGLTLRVTHSIYGKILSGKPVLRDRKSKWYVDASEYKAHTYPPFVSGWAYVTTNKVIVAILAAGQKSKYFWIDDVHITGTLRNATGTAIVDASLHFATHSEYLECCLSLRHSRNKTNNFWCDFIIGPDEPAKPYLRSQLLNQSRTCYATQTCILRTASNSLLKICVNTINPPKKQVALPRSKGKPFWEPVKLNA